MVFRSVVINAGYCIFGCHVNLRGLKSDAPMNFIWDIMQFWVSSCPTQVCICIYSEYYGLLPLGACLLRFAYLMVSINQFMDYMSSR